MRARAFVFVAGSVLLTVLLIGHEWVPDIYGLGVAADAATPWLVLAAPALALTALLCRCPGGAAATLAPVLVWAYMFGSWWAPEARAVASPPGAELRVVTQNLFAQNSSPTATARALVATDADLVAVQELGATDRAPVQQVLNVAYPYHEEIGTVALWSRYPTSGTTAADVGLDWHRGLRTHIATPQGDVVMYVVHLPSIRRDDTATRDHGLEVLSRTLTAERAGRVVVAGDFNTPRTDRHWPGFAPGYTEVQPGGPGFTWPAAFPLVRLDHILTRGLDPIGASVRRFPGPDHRAMAATIALPVR
ncbi:endonuclease/exonuclease/phosphatase family protein [Nocardia sp. NPDC020380]|uniref:endonuclease/exonuclease/phosphatase family protein n=1 Tax=Nocardia sp. NPDC020380 TaxID=3364309 RepID=UPI0037A01C90